MIRISYINGFPHHCQCESDDINTRSNVKQVGVFRTAVITQLITPRQPLLASQGRLLCRH